MNIIIEIKKSVNNSQNDGGNENILISAFLEYAQHILKG